MSNRIYIVGIGPGREEMMTGEAIAALEQADVIVGYTVYVQYKHSSSFLRVPQLLLLFSYLLLY